MAGQLVGGEGYRTMWQAAMTLWHDGRDACFAGLLAQCLREAAYAILVPLCLRFIAAPMTAAVVVRCTGGNKIEVASGDK